MKAIRIHYRATPFEGEVRDVDAVIDTVGGDIPERSWQVLKPGGILVSVAAQLSQEQAEAHGVRAMTANRAPAAVLGQIAQLIQDEQLTPAAGPEFPLAEARQAHELSQTGHGQGRIILRVEN